MKWLILLYPGNWRTRYGEELTALLETQKVSVRLVIDLIAGAIDARVSPQMAIPVQHAANGGGSMAIVFKSCRSESMSQGLQWLSLFIALGGLAVWMAVYLQLKRAFGSTAWVEAVGYSALPAFFVLWMPLWYLRGHSLIAKALMTTSAIALVFAVALIVALTTHA